MPPEKTPVQVSPDKHFVEYDGTVIELPKPANEMTQQDWMRMATTERSPLRRLEIDNQSFLGLHVVLRDKGWMPMWLRDTSRSEVPRAFDTMERAIQMGAQLVSTLEDIQAPTSFILSADGHIHRDDVVLAKIPCVVYWSLQAQNIRKSKSAIEYKSVEGKAYEGIDMPHALGKGNKQVPLYETTEHSVEYQDRPRF